MCMSILCGIYIYLQESKLSVFNLWFWKFTLSLGVPDVARGPKADFLWTRAEVAPLVEAHVESGDLVTRCPHDGNENGSDVAAVTSHEDSHATPRSEIELCDSSERDSPQLIGPAMARF